MTENEHLPWFRRIYRWGQTNLTELDPSRYDSEWWREHWRRTRVQGVIINAGGIVAFYPSKYPLHHITSNRPSPSKSNNVGVEYAAQIPGKISSAAAHRPMSCSPFFPLTTV